MGAVLSGRELEDVEQALSRRVVGRTPGRKDGQVWVVRSGTEVGGAGQVLPLQEEVGLVTLEEQGQGKRFPPLFVDDFEGFMQEWTSHGRRSLGLELVGEVLGCRHVLPRFERWEVCAGKFSVEETDDAMERVIGVLAALYGSSKERVRQIIAQQSIRVSVENGEENYVRAVRTEAPKTPPDCSEGDLSPSPELPQPCPGIVPVLTVVRTDRHVCVLSEYRRYTLMDVLRFTPEAWNALGRAEDVYWHKLFSAYQMCRAVEFAHSRGIVHGDLNPRNVFVAPGNLWIELGNFACKEVLMSSPKASLKEEADDDMLESSAVLRWVNGEISNFEYLMELNSLVGRHCGNASFHPVLPWVVDFSSKRSGWRDLTKSKFRLKKGDEQLDFTYNHSSEADQPHHIPEMLSDLTYFVYLARRAPINVLREVVRTNFEPNEYPSSMAQMYDWTPDECIPEFFTDPSIFESLNEEAGLGPLQIPQWCDSYESFIAYHRECLESKRVSESLHHWIDITFGYKLEGAAAVQAKNVPLRASGGHSLRNCGFVQLFRKPHPKRMVYAHIQTQLEKSSFPCSFEPLEAPQSLEQYEEAATFASEMLSTVEPVYYPLNPYGPGRSGDLFALGCLVYELFAGSCLFSRQTLVHYFKSRGKWRPSSLCALPVQLQNVITALIAIDVDVRPSALSVLSSSLFPGYFSAIYDVAAQIRLENLSQSLHEKIVLLHGWIVSASRNASDDSRQPLEEHAFRILLPSALLLLKTVVSEDLYENEHLGSIRLSCDCLVAFVSRLGVTPETREALLYFYCRTENISLQEHLFNYEFVVSKLLLARSSDASAIPRLVLGRVVEALTSSSTSAPVIGAARTLSIALCSSNIPEDNLVRLLILPLFLKLTKGANATVLASLISIARASSEPLLTGLFIPSVLDLLRRGHQSQDDASVYDALQFLLEILPSLRPTLIIRLLLEDPNVGPGSQGSASPSSNVLSELLLAPQSMLTLPTGKRLISVVIYICRLIGAPDAANHLLPVLSEFVSRLVHHLNVPRDQLFPNLDEHATEELVYHCYTPLRSIFGVTLVQQTFPRALGLDHVLKEYLRRTGGAERRVSQESRSRLSAETTTRPLVSPRLRLEKLVHTLELGTSWNFSPVVRHSMLAHPQGAVVRCLETVFNSSSSGSSTMRYPPRQDSFWDGPSPLEKPYTQLDGVFASAARDEVRLWKLKWTGDLEWRGTTVYRHQDMVLSSCFLGWRQQLATTDGIVRIWSLDATQTMATIISPMSSVCIAPWCSRDAVVVGGTSSWVGIIDIRDPANRLEWRISERSEPISSTVRKLAVSEKWILCGLSSGHIAVLDARMGSVLCIWAAHGAPILDLAFLSDREEQLLSVGSDQRIKVWDLTQIRASGDTPRQTHQVKTNAPVNNVALHGTDVLFGEGHRISIVKLFEPSASPSNDSGPIDVKINRFGLQPKAKSPISMVATLPEYGVLLAGREDGRIDIVG